MGLLRRSASSPRNAVELDDDVYVVSPRAAEYAVKAQKETRRAARAERKLAEKAAKGKGGKKDGRKDRKNSGDDDGDEDDKSGTPADPITGAKIKRYIGIARIVVPVVTPLVYQTVGTVRERWDSHRARQLGVAPDELSDFTGRGAALYARIHNLALSARDLRARHAGPSRRGGDDDQAREIAAFVDEADTRLTDLEAAVRAAEQMPSSRRRSAHVAVAGELDRIETRLLVHWGVGGGRSTRAIDGRDAAGPT
jgi:hypothetical protein